MSTDSSPSPVEIARQKAIKLMEVEKQNILRIIDQKQARLTVIDEQLASLSSPPSPSVAAAPVS